MPARRQLIGVRDLETKVDRLIRRGRSVREMFPELSASQEAIADAARQRHEARKRASGGDASAVAELEASTERVHAARRQLRSEMRRLIATDLAAVHDLLADPREVWRLELVPDLVGKPAYRPARRERAMMLARQLVVDEVAAAFSVESPNRHLVCGALRETLADQVPKVIVKADIASFYESISHERLRKLLAGGRALGRETLLSVNVLLDHYAVITGTPNGVPRGVSISTVLGEVVLHEFDRQFGGRTDVGAYMRFIDDIVIVFSCAPGMPRASARRSEVDRAIRALGLQPNPDKTTAFGVAHGAARKKPMDYLGYRFYIEAKGARVELGPKRVERIERRIDAAFAAFLSERKAPRAAAALVERVRLLTSNYRLVNSRTSAYVGLRFSNPLVAADSASVSRLDEYLAAHIRHARLEPAIEAQLRPLTFSSGIAEQRFIKASWRRIGSLSKVWRNA